MAKKKKSSKTNQDEDPVLAVDEEEPVTVATKPKTKQTKQSTRKNVGPPEAGAETALEAPRITSSSKQKKKRTQESNQHGDGGQIVAYDEEANQDPPSQRNRARRGPPPMDDFSDVSDDDPEYDPSMDEPRFEYSTADLADSSCRNSNCCVITVAVLCIIVAIVLSVVMIKVFAEKDAENSAPLPTTAPTTTAEANQPGLTLFQLPRETVEENRCPIGNADSDACTSTCENFDCCDPTLKASCFLNNPDGCLNYKRCHATTSGISIPPLNLAIICSPDSITSNRDECENACGSVACCWKSNVTCFDKFYSCLDYSPCQNLRTNSRVPSATLGVEEFCDTTKAGSVTQTSACDDVCKVAECCWSSGTDNCLETDFLSCLTYNPCKQLMLPEAGNAVKLPPASIRNDCSVALINSGSTGSCEKSCAAGACCAETDDSCFDQDPLACIAYEPCRVLDMDTA
jgi:hypothetical protein